MGPIVFDHLSVDFPYAVAAAIAFVVGFAALWAHRPSVVKYAFGVAALSSGMLAAEYGLDSSVLNSITGSYAHSNTPVYPPGLYIAATSVAFVGFAALVLSIVYLVKACQARHVVGTLTAIFVVTLAGFLIQDGTSNIGFMLSTNNNILVTTVSGYAYDVLTWVLTGAVIAFAIVVVRAGWNWFNQNYLHIGNQATEPRTRTDSRLPGRVGGN